MSKDQKKALEKELEVLKKEMKHVAVDLNKQLLGYYNQDIDGVPITQEIRDQLEGSIEEGAEMMLKVLDSVDMDLSQS